MHVNLLVSWLDGDLGVLRQELTIADNISRGGARVMTEVAPVAKGQIVQIREVGTDFSTKARVRGAWRGPDNIQRVNLQFLDCPSPPRLCGNATRWRPPGKAGGAQVGPPPAAAGEPGAGVDEGAAEHTGGVPEPDGMEAGADADAVTQGENPSLEPADPATERLRHELLKAHDRVKNRSYYEALGLEVWAGPTEVRAAYERMARRYHPDLVEQSLKKPAQSIMIRLGVALRTLCDPDSRAFYDRKLREAAKPPPPEETDDRTPVERDRDRAEGILREARELISSRRYWDAIGTLQAWIPHTSDPQLRHTMQIYLAHATSRNPHWLERSQEILVDVIAEDPDNVHAHLMLGAVYRRSRDDERAREMFRKVLELDPEHRQARAALEALEGVDSP
jgi:hypothetical protein